MKSPSVFALLLDYCGLSRSEAAKFLNIRQDSVNDLSTGRRPPPAGVVRELKSLARAIRTAAAEALEISTAANSAEVELGFCADDYEAQSLGWPCAAAHRAVLREIVAGLPADVEVVLVPRGSSTASAAAAQGHDK
jgi:hypothetical protein